VTSRAVRDEGSPAARAIQELAEDVHARMLVIGSSARGTLGRVAPGAVTDRLLHGAPCPVAIAPSGYAPPAEGLRRIEAAYVRRPDGEAALALAADLAQRAGATVRVRTVVEPMDPLLAGTLDDLALQDTERERVRLAEERGLDAARRLAPGRSGGCDVLHGPVVDALSNATAGADLLVCGSRGRGPVRSLLLGSTAHALVRRAATPVLVVAPAGTAPAAERLTAGRDTRERAGVR
jgi:nucleotide-binding universal stress UspA family protein